MANYDYMCDNKHVFEVTCRISERNNTYLCPECNSPGKRVFLSFPNINDPNQMVLSYPGSKKLKAGYVHSHGDRPAEKTSVGWGGAIQGGNKRHHDPIANGVIIDDKKNNKSITRKSWKETLNWQSVKIEQEDHWAETFWHDQASYEETSHEHCNQCKKLLKELYTLI